MKEKKLLNLTPCPIRFVKKGNLYHCQVYESTSINFNQMLSSPAFAYIGAYSLDGYSIMQQSNMISRAQAK
ncbi:CLUMA_CG000517, isoform A [Clunio marinus]|uniref:CLUMA_CG000517, isoform A n=1 Tax=Clunio marinus TaxID=568069 RepID=A0A1J1HGZ4_9DIPT|nr:CLUMA_CG000517, isoform A [Clunio marinus]